MKVMKFGGTSLGNAERFRHVATLIAKEENSFVVCSAMGGVTNSLVEIAGLWKSDKVKEANEIAGRVRKVFMDTAIELFGSGSAESALNRVNSYFDNILRRLDKRYSIHQENWLLAQGEIITTDLFASYLNYSGTGIKWLNALEFMQISVNNEPSVNDIKRKLSLLTGENPSGRYLTQGYICLDHEGNTSNLKRGGSDYTATLAGAALGAELIEIWTDIDGVRNNDPRYVEGTYPIRELSFDEAAELAYFGAKILHPSCVWPASINKIPIQLKNTLEPDAPGTIINTKRDQTGVTAVAAKDGITVVRIRSDRMLNAYGFLSRIFEIFEKYKTPIDVITTSEVAVSVTIDNPEFIENIESELKELGSVTVEPEQAIICVVGDVLEQNQGRAVRILDSVKQFNVKMISFGGSRNNITIVAPAGQRSDILQSLNNFLFSK